MPDSQTVLIPDGEHELALRVVRCLAHRKELEIHVLSSNPSAPVRLSRHTRGFHICNSDIDDLVRVTAIADAAKRTGAQVILPVAIPTIRLVAKHQDQLSAVSALPPMPSPALLDIFDDKWLLAQLLARENIPHPTTSSLPKGPLEPRNLNATKYPLMVKARTRNAGGGIRLCRNPDEVVNFLSKQNDRDEFFLQEFARGQDVDVSALCQNGEILGYTIQRGLIPSHKPFHPPVAIEFMHDDEALHNVQRLVRAAKWSGIVHFDCIHDSESQETKILEANPRYWRSLLGSLEAGVNFPHLAYLSAKGHQFKRPRYRNIRYARLFCL